MKPKFKEFKAKFAINDLVEFTETDKAEKNTLGVILCVRFWQSDAVNYATAYDILISNSDITTSSIPEHRVIKSYTES